MIDLLIVALLQAAAGPPAEAAPATAPAAEATEAAPVETASANTEATERRERFRCRSERITGTRLSRRVCTTAHEDQAMHDETRDQLNRMQTQMPLISN